MTSLRDAVPANVREVCAKLTAGGYQAVTVGGAVRDALLGRAVSDWDVATSAKPEQVMALFPRTIPTGVQHGTVTVVTGKGAASHVEVTTFRGEGAYSDARRPDQVTFGVPLDEDLARRDLVVNAIAYDPIHDQVHDPFGGREDIVKRVLRAVGDPVARFTEDGLRVMRAVRFAAQLEFALDPATEAAIAPALPSLAKVSRERIADELRKLLGAREPSRGLAIAERTGIVKTILPELAPDPGWLARIDAAAKRVRLAALLLPLGSRERVTAVGRGLKLSNVETELAGQLVASWPITREPAAAWTAPYVRRALAQLDRDKRAAAIELWATAAPPLADEARVVLGDPLGTGDLAVTGKDVMQHLAMAPGPAVGRILSLLLERVLDAPALNTREQLLQIAQQLELEVGR